MRNTKKIKALILLITFTTMFLITSIYAWMSTQKNVAINNMEARVEVAEGLQISLDADNWSQEIVLGETTREGGFLSGLIPNITSVNSDWSKYDEGVGAGTRNVRPKLTKDELGNDLTGAELHGNESTGYMNPVSTTGVLASGETDVQLFGGTLSGDKLKDISPTDESEAVDYYAFDIYLMNTTKDGIDTNQLQLSFDSVVEEIKSNSGVDYGLKNCVRVAFAKYDKTVATTENKEGILEGMEGAKIEQVSIWEPNADEHSEYVMKQNAKLKQAVESVSSGESLKTYALNSLPTGNLLENVYATSGTGLAEQKTLQTSGETVQKLVYFSYLLLMFRAFLYTLYISNPLNLHSCLNFSSCSPKLKPFSCLVFCTYTYIYSCYFLFFCPISLIFHNEPPLKQNILDSIGAN